MTFTVVARCPRTGQFGVGAATAMPAVGKLVSHVQSQVGAVATQANVNPYLGYDGLKLLEKGVSADEALKRLLAPDPQPQSRQFALIDRNGHTAAWTGEETPEWAGHLAGPNFSTQGNRLAGKAVLEAVAAVMQRHSDLDLAERLLLAIEAGDEHGGDTKGERSANIFVFANEEYPLWDIRVDDNDQPIKELRRLFELFREHLLPQIQQMPTRADYPLQV